MSSCTWYIYIIHTHSNFERTLSCKFNRHRLTVYILYYIVRDQIDNLHQRIYTLFATKRLQSITSQELYEHTIHFYV